MDLVSRNRGHNVWTPRQKLFITVYYRAFENSNEDLKRIFNHVFSSDLLANGIVPGTFASNTIQNRYWSLVSNQEREYEGVFNNTKFSELSTKYSDFIGDIEQSARALEIVLKRRENDNRAKIERIIEATANRSSRAEPRLWSQDLYTPSLESSRNCERASSDESSAEEAALTSSLPKTLELRPLPSRELPPLLFRTWSAGSYGTNTLTSFRASLFPNGVDIQPMPDPQSNDVLLYARNHLDLLIHEQTPFISISTSLIWVIHLAKKRRAEAGGEHYISVIDGSKLKEVLWASAVMRTLLNRRFVSFVYHGARFEYMVWGSIDSVVKTVSLESLEALSGNFSVVDDLLRLPSIDPSSRVTAILKSLGSLQRRPAAVGRGLGILARWLDLVDPIHVRVFSTIVLQNWGINDSGSWTTRPDFLDGVSKGLRDKRVAVGTRETTRPAADIESRAQPTGQATGLKTPPITPRKNPFHSTQTAGRQVDPTIRRKMELPVIDLRTPDPDEMDNVSDSDTEPDIDLIMDPADEVGL